MHTIPRKLLSQNFLHNRELARRLVRESSIGRTDTVLEIGPGKGVLTEPLLHQAGKVIAVEFDDQLYRELQRRFIALANFELHHADFLTFPLPDDPFKTFSNIPFRLTADILRKLLRSANAPVDSYLLVQREAAAKWMGNSLAGLLLQPWFNFTIECTIERNAFVPAPRIDVVLLRIRKREHPLVEAQDRETFENWLCYIFSRQKPYIVELVSHPTQMDVLQWVDLFQRFRQLQNPTVRRRIRNSANKLFAEQAKLEKIHRTRNDPNWKDLRTME